MHKIPGVILRHDFYNYMYHIIFTSNGARVLSGPTEEETGEEEPD